MHRPFVFFDLGQTLIDEWEFIAFFDSRMVELLNGFGAKIDIRNYRAVRDSIIRDRRIGSGSVRALVTELARLLAPGGSSAILSRLEPEIVRMRKSKFRFAGDAADVLQKLNEMQIEMGIIANQSSDISAILQDSGLSRYFKVAAISSSVLLEKPDLAIFRLAVSQAGRLPEQCVMVGDRLDNDICPANMLGMKTVRYTNSLFSLQRPVADCEHPTYSVGRLSELPGILEKVISEQGQGMA